MLTDFGNILLFIIAAIFAIVAVLTIGRFIRPNKPNEEKLSTYESGEAPIGSVQVQFDLRFYVIALIFVLFEAELIFLFPWAIVFGQKELITATNGLWGWFAISEMFVFVGVLVLGLAYCWSKGYLEWVKPSPEIPKVASNVPKNLYEAVNEKYK